MKEFFIFIGWRGQVSEDSQIPSIRGAMKKIDIEFGAAEGGLRRAAQFTDQFLQE